MSKIKFCISSDGIGIGIDIGIGIGIALCQRSNFVSVVMVLERAMIVRVSSSIGIDYNTQQCALSAGFSIDTFICHSIKSHLCS